MEGLKREAARLKSRLVSSIYTRGEHSREHYTCTTSRTTNWSFVPKNVKRGKGRQVNKWLHQYEMNVAHGKGSPIVDPLLEMLSC